MMRPDTPEHKTHDSARTFKKRRLALEPAGPKRGPPSPRGVNASRVARRASWHYGTLRGDVAFETRAGTQIEGRLVVELQGDIWLVPPAVEVILSGGGPVRCAVMPHCAERCVLARMARMNAGHDFSDYVTRTRLRSVDPYLSTPSLSSPPSSTMVCTINEPSDHFC